MKIPKIRIWINVLLNGKMGVISEHTWLMANHFAICILNPSNRSTYLMFSNNSRILSEMHKPIHRVTYTNKYIARDRNSSLTYTILFI